jgi:hypothetical protein
MKTKSFIATGALGLALAAAILSGCKKDPPMAPVTNANADITPAMDEANASFASTDSKNIADAVMQSQSSANTPSADRYGSMENFYGHCIKVYGSDTVVNGKQDTIVYIDFGGTDCFGDDQRERRGTIIVFWGLTHPGETQRQAYFDSANTITQTFRNYFLRKTGIAGIRTWTNEDHNVSGYQNWTHTANLTLTYPNGQTATWEANRNNAIAQVNGVWYYELTGDAKGMSRNGIEYTYSIASPVYITVLPWWAGGCPWPEAGSVTITRTNPASGSITFVINYGTLGTCSGTKTVTVSGSGTKTFAMW